MLSRRQFLNHTLKGSSLVALSSMVPQFVSRTAQAAAPGKDNILVVLEMTGGNDGLNTVIPYADDLYHKARPTLRQTKDVVIRLDDHVGLHSGMVGFRSMWEKGQLAVVQGVGYPNPERSHFEAMDIWQSADPQRIPDRLAGPGRGRDRQPRRRCAHSPCRPEPPAPGPGRSTGRRSGHRRRSELVPPRAEWRQGRSTKGTPQVAGRAGGAIGRRRVRTTWPRSYSAGRSRR